MGKVAGVPETLRGWCKPEDPLWSMRTNIVLTDQLQIPVVKSMTESAPYTSFLMLVSVGFQAVWLTGMFCISSMH